MSEDIKSKIEAVEKQLREFDAQGLKPFISSSFQTHSLPMLHIIAKLNPNIPVYFLQTGFHFPETLSFRDTIASEFGLNILNIESHVPKIQQRNAAGNFYFTSDPDYCCFLNKTQPMQPLLQQYDVWINGVRADQNANRKNLRIIEETPNRAKRYHPMLNWTKQEIWQYISVEKLPRHPLDAKGYVSIGCEPCTVKPSFGDERAGRWLGQSKTECGLHTELVKK